MALESLSQTSPNNPREKIVILLLAVLKMHKKYIFEKARLWGFTGPQISLIYTLYKNPEATLHEVSEQMGLSKSTVSGIIDRLVSQEVINREIPKYNRRILKLSLTQSFLKSFDIESFKHSYLENVMGKSSEEDLNKIIAGLETLLSLMVQSENNNKA